MKHLLAALALGTCLLTAQTPNLSGVWKANLDKSKMNGPAPSSYLMIVDQQGSKLVETIGITTTHGEQRANFTYNTDGKPASNFYRGLFMRTTASASGNTLTLDSKVADGHATTVNERYTLAPDGNTLTVEMAITNNGKDARQTLVLEKQPDSAGEALRKPEETAGAHFKNVQLLKDVPASQFIDAMRRFSMSLGVECDHCHVQNQFESDSKPAKLMARTMITMTNNINQQTFNGKMEVRCYTCHQGKVEPQSHPAF